MNLNKFMFNAGNVVGKVANSIAHASIATTTNDLVGVGRAIVGGIKSGAINTGTTVAKAKVLVDGFKAGFDNEVVSEEVLENDY